MKAGNSLSVGCCDKIEFPATNGGSNKMLGLSLPDSHSISE